MKRALGTSTSVCGFESHLSHTAQTNESRATKRITYIFNVVIGRHTRFSCFANFLLFNELCGSISIEPYSFRRFLTICGFNVSYGIESLYQTQINYLSIPP